MDYAVRFIWVTLLTYCAAFFVVKLDWPYDHPFNTSFHDWVRGIGVLSASLVVALYDLVRVLRERRQPPSDLP